MGVRRSICRLDTAAGRLLLQETVSPANTAALWRRTADSAAAGFSGAVDRSVTLPERFQIYSGEAFRMLLRSSRNGNVKLPAFAAQLVWSGGLPWPAARHEVRLKALLG